jgi:hypothetical protein
MGGFGVGGQGIGRRGNRGTVHEVGEPVRRAEPRGGERRVGVGGPRRPPSGEARRSEERGARWRRRRRARGGGGALAVRVSRVVGKLRRGLLVRLGDGGSDTPGDDNISLFFVVG